MDPRVKISAADLEQQFETQSRLASLMAKSTHAIQEARSLHDQLAKLSADQNDSLATSLKDLDRKVSAILQGPAGGDGTQPSLTNVNGSATAVYAELDRADAKPTSAQAEAVSKIEKDFATVAKQWDNLKSQELPALNRQLRAVNRPEIHLEPSKDSDEGDGQDID
jgi:hypothetical protein